MYTRKIASHVLIVFLLALILGAAPSLTSVSTAATPPPPAMANPHAAPAGTPGIRINEVMFAPAPGAYEWVELKNAGPTPVTIGGYGLTDEDGHWYRIPNALPPVPPGAFVVVIFDGRGSSQNDYDFADNVAVLHTPAGLVDIFADTGDQIALYVSVPITQIHLPLIARDFQSWNPPVPEPPGAFPAPSIVSFVAWGIDPGEEAANATNAGLWSPGWFKSLARGLGDHADTGVTPDESIGRVPGEQTGTADDWTLYLSGQTTRGRENAWPVISWYYPASGATIDSATFAVSWNPVEGATGYRFQLDNDSDFSSPSVNLTLNQATYIPTSPVAAGAYFWRVKVLFSGGESPWSPGVAVRSLVLPSAATADVGLSAVKTLGVAWQLQRKDTNMLCLDGDPETGASAWDRPHTTRGIHGRMYCVRASIAMMASYYGGRLSQDRISYQIFKGGPPEGDLGHNIGVPAPLNPIQTNTLAWALGLSPSSIPVQEGKPTFAQIKTWIDANRPIMARIPGHMRVIDGYWEFSLGSLTWQFIHLLDPWDRAKWVNYADDNIAHVWVGPAGANSAPSVRSDEDLDRDGILDTVDDSDGDGICDFDERYRFGLDYRNADTDGDLIPDKLDMREYLFTSTGAYRRQNPDIDGDGLRKERDKDNDYARNDGLIDGCEDSNQNGVFETPRGESNNFDPTDDMALHVQLRWPTLGADVDLHLIRPNGTFRSPNDCYFGNRSPDWGIAGNNCDNPRLDVDCIRQCTVENIRLSRLENGVYTVAVHYYSDHGRGPTTPRVTVWVQGVRHEFSLPQLTNKQIWTVCTIDWPSKRIRPGSMVTMLPEAELLNDPAKE
jgi:hypothetical protein